MTEYGSIKPCPVCRTHSTISQVIDPFAYDCNNVACPRCGTYSLSDTSELIRALTLDAPRIKLYATTAPPNSSSPMHSLCCALGKYAYTSKSKSNTDECRALISHVLSRGRVKRLLTLADFANILTHNLLPIPAEQAEILVKYLGDGLSGFGDPFTVTKESDQIKNLGARIGSKIGAEWINLYALIVALEMENLIAVNWDQNNTAGGNRIIRSISLTLPGWDKYVALGRITSSKSAFICNEIQNQ
jgi:hypothetical protein